MERTKFMKYLGNSPTIKILDYLISCRDFECSLSDIARNSNVSWGTLHKIWKNLEKTGMVTYTRNIGMAKLYKLNRKNTIVQRLVSLFDYILDTEREKIIKKQEKKILIHA